MKVNLKLVPSVIEEATLSEILSKHNKDAQKQGSRDRHKYEIDLPKAMKRANSSNITGKYTGTAYDPVDNMIITRWETTTKSNGNQHYQYIAFPTDVIEDYTYERFDTPLIKILQDYDVWLFCDCKSFKYHFSNMDFDNNTLYKGHREDWEELINYPVQGLYSVNPERIGGMCKHLYTLVKTLFGWSWTSIRGDINRLIKDDIDLYQYLIVDQGMDEETDLFSDDVEQFMWATDDLQDEYRKLDTEATEYFVDYNTDLDLENYDDKTEEFRKNVVSVIKDFEKLLKDIEDFVKEVKSFHKLSEYRAGSNNDEMLELIYDIVGKNEADTKSYISDMKKTLKQLDSKAKNVQSYTTEPDPQIEEPEEDFEPEEEEVVEPKRDITQDASLNVLDDL